MNTLIIIVSIICFSLNSYQVYGINNKTETYYDGSQPPVVQQISVMSPGCVSQCQGEYTSCLRCKCSQSCLNPSASACIQCYVSAMTPAQQNVALNNATTPSYAQMVIQSVNNTPVINTDLKANVIWPKVNLAQLGGAPQCREYCSAYSFKQKSQNKITTATGCVQCACKSVCSVCNWTCNECLGCYNQYAGAFVTGAQGTLLQDTNGNMTKYNTLKSIVPKVYKKGGYINNTNSYASVVSSIPTQQILVTQQQKLPYIGDTPYPFLNNMTSRCYSVNAQYNCGCSSFTVQNACVQSSACSWGVSVYTKNTC